MKKTLLLLLLLFGLLISQAIVRRESRAERNERIEAVMADAKLPFTTGDNSVFEFGNDISWRNGMYRCPVIDIDDDNVKNRRVGFILDDADDYEKSKHYYEVKLTAGKPRVTNRRGVTVKHQVAGNWDLLVFSNAKGAVIDVAIRRQDNYYDDDQKADFRDMINGIYAGTGNNVNDTVVFGTVYDIDDYDYRLPGDGYGLHFGEEGEKGFQYYDRLKVEYVEERMKRVEVPHTTREVDAQGVYHYYANGREISQREFEKYNSCGYGGHGSLHGPLFWWIKPQGNDLEVELYSPFQEELDAFYSNFRDQKFTLKWVRSPYKDMKDRWAVLSMRPVTRGMLSFFDKTTLQQMLTYLKGRRTPTDIERLNKSLINTIVLGN